MTTDNSLDSVIKKLKSMDFQDAEILDIFHAVKLEWGAVFQGDNLEIRDPTNSDNLLLKVRLQNGKLTSWTCGSACSNTVLNQVLALAGEIREPHEHTYMLSRIMFSQRELKGKWRYKDLFQIVPCLHEVKVGSGLDWYNEIHPPFNRDDPRGPPFPFLLEISVPKISNDWLQHQIGMKQLDRVEHLLCTFLRGVSNLLLWPSDRQWTAIKSTQGFGIDYHLLYSGIGTERGGQYDSWTVWDGIEASVFVTADGTQYDDSLLVFQGDELLIRDDLEQLIDKYFNVDSERRRMIDRAGYFFTLAKKLRSNADLAAMNFSIAIECLIEYEESNLCQECGKEKLSLSKMFRRFLEKYAPVSDLLVRKRDQLYSVRSMIAHGSRSFVSDYSSFSLARDTDTPMLMEWLVRKSIVGWLKKL